MPRKSTRERLIEAARNLFLKQGYTATGVAQILKEAGARSGSLYYFFPTKHDLLLAVLEQYRELLWPEVMGPAFEAVQDPIERVFAILAGYRQMLEYTHCRQGCPIGNLALELCDEHADVRELIAANFNGWQKAVSRCIAEAAERLPGDVDPDQLGLFVLVTMEGAVMLARAHRSLEPYDSAVKHLRDYFTRLIEDRGAAPSAGGPPLIAARPGE